MKSSSEIVVKANGLGKVYHKQELDSTDKIPFHALKDVSFELKKGEILGVIGQNGSGKSTLLRILSGITKPSEGSVEIDGSVASILDIGTGIHPDLTGRENTFLRGQLLGMTKSQINEVYDELVEFSGVGEFMDTPVKHYSSGMFLRLAFSIIVHLKSDILLLDEVLAVGDELFRRKCSEKISQIVSSGSTVILVSHDLRSVMDVCSSVMLLEKGEVQVIDTPMAVVGNAYLSKLAGISDSDGGFNQIKISELQSDDLGFEVLEFVVENEQEEEVAEQDTSLDLYIKLKYSVVKENVQLAIGLKDFLSNRILDDSPIQAIKDQALPLTGTFTAKWKLKGHLFNPGVYHIDLYVIDSELNTLKRFDNALSITYRAPENELKVGLYRAAFNIDLGLQVTRVKD